MPLDMDALTDRRVFASHPSAVAETNSLGTLRILRAANLLEDLQKVVLMSSGLVYGGQPWDLPRITEDFGGVILHQPAQIFSSQRAVGDDAGVAGPVTDFPRFANDGAGRTFLGVEAFEFASAPDAFLESRLKSERIEHGQLSG